MAIALRATTVGPNNNATTTTINLPAGTTTGDVTIIGFARVANYTDAAAQSITVPAGWTTLCNGNGQGACYRAYQAGDAASVTLTATGTADWWATVAATYSGCDTSSPVDTFNACVSTSSSSPSSPFGPLYMAPSVNPNWQNDQLLTIYTNSSIGGAGTFTPSAGMTQRVIQGGGPNVVIADQALGTSNSPTGAKIATWLGSTVYVHAGIQVLLKTAGATAVTPASPVPTWGTAIGIYLASQVASATVLLSRAAPQAGDLVVILVSPGQLGAVAVAVAGYTQAATVSNGYVFTRVFQAGDADPVVALSPACFGVIVAICLRKSGVGGINPVIEQSATAAGSGGASPFSATVPSLTPANATEYLLAAWMVSHQNGATFTPPGGLTARVNVPTGPAMLVMDMQTATTPTGTYLAQATTTSPVATFGAIEVLVSVASAVVVATNQARVMVMA